MTRFFEFSSPRRSVVIPPLPPIGYSAHPKEKDYWSPKNADGGRVKGSSRTKVLGCRPLRSAAR